MFNTLLICFFYYFSFEKASNKIKYTSPSFTNLSHKCTTFLLFLKIIYGFQLKGKNLGSEAFGTHGLHSII
jgi:hypothetical protein